jgi:hypothetical protein
MIAPIIVASAQPRDDDDQNLVKREPCFVYSGCINDTDPMSALEQSYLVAHTSGFVAILPAANSLWLDFANQLEGLSPVIESIPGYPMGRQA